MTHLSMTNSEWPNKHDLLRANISEQGQVHLQSWQFSGDLSEVNQLPKFSTPFPSAPLPGFHPVNMKCNKIG